MALALTFGCAGEGLSPNLKLGALGSYDGADRWSLMLANIGSDDEQVMTQTHEGLHHELQLGTGWGLLSSMAWLLASRGFRPHALGELFEAMVADSTQTHEVFATVLSVSTFSAAHARDLLAGNSRYYGYLSRGLALVSPQDTEFRQFHFAAVSEVLRACMRPAATFGLLDRGFDQITRRDLDRQRDAPDRRLAAFERFGGPSTWGPVFAGLIAEYPDRGGDQTGRSPRHLPDNEAAVERLHRFEAEVLHPRCLKHACGVLERAGLPSIGSREQSRLARAVKDAVAAADPEMADHLVLIGDRRPLYEEAFQFERQQIVLREPLPVRVAGSEETLRNPSAFSFRHGGRDYGYVLWADRGVLGKQFVLPPEAELPGQVTALISPPDESGVVRLGLLPPGVTPQQCQRIAGDLALITLTTHATLAGNGEAMAVLQQVHPVFVLMDLPAATHIGHWISQGVAVRAAVRTLGGHEARLALATFGIARKHPFIFLDLTSELSAYVLVDQLRRRHGESIEPDDAADPDRLAAQPAIVGFLLRTWHVLDQRGAT